MLIPTVNNINTVTDLRVNTIALLDEVDKSGSKYIFQRSQPRAVILSIAEYEKLAQRFEDLTDELRANQLIKLPKGKGKTLSEVQREYGV
ncbi:MAG: type II toxin-antitoxin system prevent-host-death family antitoxin [Candidatus Pacebacteria bacterium]|jgi:prevent-host-death family protein|nr:type II toxin-antitoxin system prevent-host-death family antitoxin [Candidatus Paceibacterota bacterium]MBT3511473.1 type II toxin-antitoxin system prevent-host-death family antitoxin [Candidatus Paceibacterota bacterium]MBT4004674.1 type II toxin-antitoxin system prevent-host-death family antitoxin [Candidatus Paceibacterota bacterium]MBT4358408.1 type II toxin-antitoxin system prevent-host-death family antitoxin [Candidatus Paceibacterota bacterium]MBT4680843.1 type II toxin-antitoxin syst